jgi:Uma2 family endonuclease
MPNIKKAELIEGNVCMPSPVYRRNGVQEYLVLLAQEERAVWHGLMEGMYQVLETDGQGIVRSQVFPGLWLHPEHFWNGNLPALMAE